MATKICVTGSNGQLGSELKKISTNYKAYEFIFTDVDTLDITQRYKVYEFMEKHKPDIVINCAAYTNVDGAETDKDAAIAINKEGTKNLVLACASDQIFLIHISTDYVYDDNINTPIKEDHIAKPKSFYGKSKLDGEMEVIFNTKFAYIIRTSWLYSSFGNNFVKAILKKANASVKETLKVVFDQIGTPTYAEDLAYTIMRMLPRALDKEKPGVEIFNYSNEGVCSWYDFANAIIEITKLSCIIKPIETKELRQSAIRPHYSVMNKKKISEKFMLTIPYWKKSLKKCIQEIEQNEQ